MTETWTAEQCAAAWGVKPSTWRAYVARGQAPKPLPGRWDADEVRRYTRPGQGRRRPSGQ